MKLKTYKRIEFIAIAAVIFCIFGILISDYFALAAMVICVIMYFLINLVKD